MSAEFLFATRHFSMVGFVIVTGEMEKSVQHQDLDFDTKRMTLLTGLTQRGGDADGQISGDFERAGSTGGKREHIRGFVLAAKLPVQTAYGSVGRQQNSHLAPQLCRGLRLAQEPGEGAGRWNSLSASQGVLGWGGEDSTRGTHGASRHLHA